MRRARTAASGTGRGRWVRRAGGEPGAPLPAPGGAAHQAALERAFGRVLAVITAGFVVEFWFAAGTLTGQRPGSLAADVLLTVVLVWQAALALRGPPAQRVLNVTAVAALQAAGRPRSRCTSTRRRAGSGRC